MRWILCYVIEYRYILKDSYVDTDFSWYGMEFAPGQKASFTINYEFNSFIPTLTIQHVQPVNIYTVFSSPIHSWRTSYQGEWWENEISDC